MEVLVSSKPSHLKKVEGATGLALTKSGDERVVKNETRTI